MNLPQSLLPRWLRGGQAFAVAVCSLLLAFAPARSFAQPTQITITPTTISNPVAGVNYSQTLFASGGTGNKTFALAAGNLPPGLTLSAAGVISGIPTASGTFPILITATDAAGAVGSQGYTLVVIGPPTVTNPISANVSAGSAILGGSITSDGGSALTGRGVVYSLTSVNANPQLGGFGVSSTPATTVGTGDFTVNVTGLTQGSAYSYRAYASNSTGTGYSPVNTFTTSVLALTPTTIPNSLTGVNYSQNFFASGGTAPYVFSVSSGILPPGITLTTAGALNGIPTTEGSYPFTITVTDAAGATRAQSYVITVTPAVAITTPALPDHGVNLAGYGFVVQATGGTGNKTFSITQGGLPPGLTMDSAGLISGTPFAAGTYIFTVTATDQLGATASRTYTVAIGMPLTFTTGGISDGSVNQTNYNQTIFASGGMGFKSFSVASGSLPPGLNLSSPSFTSSAVISGTPTATGTYAFTLNATDQAGAVTSRAFTVTINPALTITTTTLPPLALSLGTNQTIVATGGTGSRTFAVTSGTLPSGLSLSSSGELTGTPNTAGTSNFTVTVTDSAGATISQSYSIVAGGPIALRPATLPNPIINDPGYNEVVTATGGTGNKTFAISSGALPTGLSLSSAGVVFGNPTVAGTYNFTITATDAAGATGSQAYTLVVAPPVNLAQTITFTALPNRIATSGPIVLAGTATSGLPITYTVTGPAVINGNTLTLTGLPGVVTVTASQAGSTTYTAAPVVVQTFTVIPADRLINLSSRVRIAPDANRTLIAGFVIGGQQPKRVLLRAVGPALRGFGVTDAVANPRLQLFNAGGQVILENENWSGADTAAAFAQVSAFALPAGSLDAALLTTLSPGSYTMQITAGTETGTVLAEVYDASANPGGENQRLVNISTRGNVEAGDGVLIGGFVITGTTPKRVLVRGIGPSLGAFGVANTITDPRLTVYSGSTVIAQNEDWSVSSTVVGQPAPATAAEVTAAATATGAFALAAGSRDAAVVITLPPGAYTAQVAGSGTATGVALVEVYEVP